MKNLIVTGVITFLVFGIGIWCVAAQINETAKLNVAIMIFDGVQIIDYTGPYEVLGSRGRRHVFTVAEKPDTVTTNMGMKVVPNYSFADAPKIDILILPGGGNILVGSQGRGVGAQLDNTKVIKWIQDTSAEAKYVMSVCNGAFFLAKAGLLENLPATTTAGFISSLQRFSPTTKPVYDKRYVDNGKIMTTAGLSSGIDGALHLIEKLDGPGWAKATALGIEYNWRPDSDFARASIADVKLPNSLGKVLDPTAVPLDMKGNKTEWEEKWIITTDATPADVLAGLEKDWARETGWSKVGSDNTRTNWKLVEASGEIWNGWAAAEPTGEKGKISVTFGIVAQRKKTAVIREEVLKEMIERLRV